ncbi:MAG TPA: hypothetical protein VK986_21355, partial [Tepidisphaeraceae bacterium]|nr:hypothetical protein [Tepidisphaeraceae bacterium]
STGLTGAAGEYHVAAELSRRGRLATVTIKNSPGTDVLAQRRDRSAMVAAERAICRNFLQAAGSRTIR